jgi:hypothetical protein
VDRPRAPAGESQKAGTLTRSLNTWGKDDRAGPRSGRCPEGRNRRTVSAGNQPRTGRPAKAPAQPTSLRPMPRRPQPPDRQLGRRRPRTPETWTPWGRSRNEVRAPGEALPSPARRSQIIHFGPTRVELRAPNLLSNSHDTPAQQASHEAIPGIFAPLVPALEEIAAGQNPTNLAAVASSPITFRSAQEVSRPNEGLFKCRY